MTEFHTPYNCMVRLDKILSIYVMRCSIWYQLHNLKTVKITHGGVLLLVKIKAETCNFFKSYAPPWVFSRFLNCTNGNKLRKASHLILKEIRIFMQYVICVFLTLEQNFGKMRSEGLGKTCKIC